MHRLIHDGDSIYFIDEDCVRKKEEQERKKETAWQKKGIKKGHSHRGWKPFL